jgi:assimilatory nitrate reductase catalytic subunit
MSFSQPYSETETFTQTITTETRQQQKLRTGEAAPRFLQGVFPFAGRGFFDLGPLNDALCYQVPPGKSAAVIYFRAGNLSDDLLYLALSVNGQPVRYFPVGPKADFHVPLSIVESHPAGSRIEICLAAPRGLTGSVVVDIGIMEESETR